MRKCPKCKNWELDVTLDKKKPQENPYFFRCWNCGFECSKEEGETYQTEQITITIDRDKLK